MNKVLRRRNLLGILLVLELLIAFNVKASVLPSIYVDKEVKEIEKYLPSTISDRTFQLFSHGRAGELYIGGRWLSGDELSDFIKSQISSKTTSINIYGCNFAAGETGLQAVSLLEKNLGIKISASDDITGIDGDWELEVGTGLGALILEEYNGNLQTGIVRYQTDIQGGAIMFGNTFYAPGGPADVDSDPSTLTSTYSDLRLPTGSIIKKAFLYIEAGGVALNGNGLFYGDFKLKVPGGSYVNIPISSGYIVNKTSPSPNPFGYQCAYDVTEYITSPSTMYSTSPSGGASGRYYVADVKNRTVSPYYYDQYGGGWAMIIIYENPNSQYRNVTVADNWRYLPGDGADIITDIPNIRTPEVGPVNVSVGMTMSYSDRGYAGDYIAFGEVGSPLVKLTDHVSNSANNIGNSTVSMAASNNVTTDGLTLPAGNVTTRNPNLDENTHHNDIDVLDASGILNPSTSPIDARIQVHSTSGDFIWSGAYFVSVDLGGVIMKKDLSTSSILDGETATYTFTLWNPSNSTVTYNALDFTDSLPDFIKIATPANVTMAGPSYSVVANDDEDYISMSGLTLAPGDTATFTVDITNKPGAYNDDCSSLPDDYTNGFNNFTLNSKIIAPYEPVCLQVLCSPEGSVNASCDFDGDGVSNKDDIDDDNDGILDAVESPSCFYSLAEAMPYSEVTSDFTWNSTNSLEKTYDGDNSSFGNPNVSLSIAGLSLFEFSNVAPIPLANINLQITTKLSTDATSTWRLEGWDGSSWVSLSAAQDMNTSNTTYSFLNSSSNPNVVYEKYRIAGVSGTNNTSGRLIEVTLNAGLGYSASLNPKEGFCNEDNDMDGFPNHYDLDADGDGCYDSYEAGVTSATSTGAVTDSITAGPYNGNGFADALQSAMDTNQANYTHTYNFATAAGQNVCSDFDDDGIPDLVDIDDDNDGILDAVESPSCFYTREEASAYGDVTTDFNWSNTLPFELAYDDNDGTYGVLQGSQSIVGLSLIEFTNELTIPVATVDVVVTTRLSFNTSSTWQLEGWDGSTWVALSAAQAIYPNNSTISFANISPNPNIAYAKYRIAGVAGTNVNGGRLVEVYFTSGGEFTPSSYPKSELCMEDTDQDGSPNHLDLDSDDDGCFDKVEAGIPGALINGTDSVVALTPSDVSGNGFADSLQSTIDTNAYMGNYTYGYAIDSSTNVCLDSDGDGIADLVDLDDDNDGILDSIECAYPEYSPICATSMSPVFGFGNTGSNKNYNNTAAPCSNNSNGTVDTWLPPTTSNGLIYANPDPSPDGGAYIGAGAWFGGGESFEIPLTGLEAGATYEVCFWQRRLGRNDWTSGHAYWELSFLGTDTLQGDSIAYNEPFAWTQVCKTLTASSSSETLSLRAKPAGGNSASYAYLGIDGVSMKRITDNAGNPYICDLDGDGIPNYLDLDSDGDGCPDAIEGGASFTNTDLYTSSMDGGNSGPDFSGSRPIPVQSNLGTTVGTVDSVKGVPTIAIPTLYTSVGQTLGSSQDSSILDPNCAPIITPDSIVLEPAPCPTCPVTACVVADDIDTTGGTYSSCTPSPLNYSISGPDANGCMTYTPNGSVIDTVYTCIVACDIMGNCDTTYISIPPPLNVTDPDINAGYVNQSMSGDVSTNDNVPAGTTYGSVTPDASNPNATDVPVVNSDGSYTFTGTMPGVYKFEVEVCAPSQSSPCPTELLTITVLDATSTTNSPVANTDQSSTMQDSPVMINILDNDAPGNTDGSLGIPTVTSPPSNGTVSIDPATGVATYTPNMGFTGIDTFEYEVCDTVPDPDVCETAIAIIEVLPTGENGLTATDDYATTTDGVPAMGNALSNDVDPNGDPLVVTAVTTPTAIPGGTYTIDANGNYTFAPTPGFTGSTSFTYEVCDNQGLCETATVYITVSPGPETNPDINISTVNVPVMGDVSTNDNVPAGTTYGSVTPDASNPNATDVPVVNSDGSYTFTGTMPGVYNFEVEVCAPGQSSPCPTELLTITVLDTTTLLNPPVANVDHSITYVDQTVIVNVKGNDLASSSNGLLGNPTIISGPSNGTAVINSNGELVYTPATSFVGMDTVYYEICDTVPDPDLCTTTMAIIEVLPSGGNSIVANDDYNSGLPATLIEGNALDNDSDPNDDLLSVTPNTISTPGVGTFTISSNGTYTFTSEIGFSGPVNFVYEVCDAQGLCTNATIYILVTNDNVVNTSIELIEFTAIPEDCAVRLAWILSVYDLDTKVSLERRIANSDRYSTLVSYDLSATNNDEKHFDYLDTDIISNAKYYYRLKSEDEAGNVSYSDIRFVSSTCMSSKDINVYPNPSEGHITINFEGFEGESVKVDIYDMLGRVVYKSQKEMTDNHTTEYIDLSGYSDGQYIINFITDKGFTKQVVLQKK